MARSTVSKLHWMANRPTDEKNMHLKAHSKTVIVSVFACKLKALANSRGSYPLADMDSINSTCTYYNTVNKRIHKISAYFLAAASDKHMRLLTSLYGEGGYDKIIKDLPDMF